MSDEVKTRLYVTTVVMVMAVLYVGPEYSLDTYGRAQHSIFDVCLKSATEHFMIAKCQRDFLAVDPPLGGMIISYLPAGLLFWISWLLGMSYRLTREHYPAKTMIVLRWIAYLAILFSAGLTLEIATAHGEHPNLLNILQPVMIFSGWVIAPMLFQKLLAPRDLSSPPLALRLALGAMFGMPVIGAILFLTTRYH